MSGQPGNPRLCTRKRKPRAESARRTTRSGFVSTDRTRRILKEVGTSVLYARFLIATSTYHGGWSNSTHPIESAARAGLKLRVPARRNELASNELSVNHCGQTS